MGRTDRGMHVERDLFQRVRLAVEHIAQSSTSDFVSVLQQKIKEVHTPPIAVAADLSSSDPRASGHRQIRYGHLTDW